MVGDAGRPSGFRMAQKKEALQDITLRARG
jgi:hypothetical protein